MYDKQEFADSLKGQINQLLYMIYGLLALAIVIAVIGIVNTLSLSVIERTREIGLLRAVGLSRSRLRRMVTLESVTISVMGAVLGMAVGLLIGVLLRQSLADDLTELSTAVVEPVRVPGHLGGLRGARRHHPRGPRGADEGARGDRDGVRPASWFPRPRGRE